MKKREVERLVSAHVVPVLNGYAARGDLLVAEPVGHLLRAFCFDRSQLDTRGFRVWAFVQPLYVPLDDIVFTFGRALGDWSVPTEDERPTMAEVTAAIRHDGLPLLESIRDPADLLVHGRKLASPLDPLAAEGVAYAAILAEAAPATVEALIERMVTLAREDAEDLAKYADDDEDFDYVRERIERADLVLDAYRRSLDEAVALLRRWEADTRAALGV